MSAVAAYLVRLAMTAPTPDDSDLPLRTRKRADLPPEFAGAVAPRHTGIWNRPDRPRIVGIIGWVCAAIGYLSFVIKLAQMPSFFFPDLMKAFNPNYVLPPYTRGQFLGSVLILLAEALIGLLAIAGGLGSLKLREWGRRLILAYAVAALAMSVVRGVFQYVTFDAMLDNAIAASTQPIDRQAAENAQFFYFVTSTMMFAVWPLLVITIMSRRHVRQAFARAQGTPLPEDSSPDAWRSNGDR